MTADLLAAPAATRWAGASDPALLAHDTFTLVVQVNGKRRDQIEAAADTPESELLELARASQNVRRHLDGKQVVKEIEAAQGRMKKKVLGAEEALKGGVSCVVIADGRIQNPISNALSGNGTVIQ